MMSSQMVSEPRFKGHAAKAGREERCQECQSGAKHGECGSVHREKTKNRGWAGTLRFWRDLRVSSCTAAEPGVTKAP